ncbi:hypothetical protein [Curtobacterium sp. PhB172]|uniref:hypothetical protein n=1 Tax=Curtobacterium sp. PhB172 TaxID=2485196 RepID=UPI0011CD7691|nr:hypothetical protein [Curtobacterium sp. PhB172]
MVAAISGVNALFEDTSGNLGGTWNTGDFELSVRQQLSRKVDRLFGAIECSNAPGAPPVYLEKAPWHEMQVMKLITKRLLVSSPAASHCPAQASTTYQAPSQAPADAEN